MNVMVDSQFSTSGSGNKVTKDTYTQSNYSFNKTEYGTVKAQGLRQTGCILDIADKVMDNEAYGGHGLTQEEIMQQMGNVNASTHTDFMIVMSNCVSDEDYGKLQEEGFSAKATDVETYVSIVDEIKVTLARAGVEIQGYNDDLDKEKVKEIVGNTANVNELVDSIADKFAQADIPVTQKNIEELATAFDEASKISELSEDAIKYMVQNKKAPTIDNLYKAEHVSSSMVAGRQAQGYYSDGSGYYAKKADTISWDSLETQIEDIVKESGIAENKEQFEAAVLNAKWLVQSGIELNEENLTLVSDLKNIKLPLDKNELLGNCVTAMQNGKSAKDALVTGEKSVTEKADEIVDKINNISDTAISQVVEEGEELNLKNLSAKQRQINDLNNKTENKIENVQNKTENVIDNETVKTQLKEVEARRQLEEIRLMMTKEAGRKLIKSGINIDTTELSKLVEKLKETEQNIKAVLYKGENEQENEIRAQIFEETIFKTDELAQMPVQFIGKIAPQIGEYTINTLYEAGKNQKTDGLDAVAKYETLMTAPRKDLGDKISKAFRNVDDILEDMGIEKTSQNQKAVRILGYNSMAITKENIEQVKRADSIVTGVIDKMTPATTLKMIRENKNPLEMSLKELDKYLNEQSGNGQADAEKYSKFLQKLDKSGNITAEEREAYIGIYRMFHQIEKSDGAVIGSIVASGAEMNFKNMLSAVRTRKNKNMDFQVDDEFGGLEKLITKGKAIDTQINTGFNSNTSDNNQFDEKNAQEQMEYYARLSGEINSELAENTDVDKLKNVNITENTTIEKFADDIKTTHMSEKAIKKQLKEELKEIQESAEKLVSNATKSTAKASVKALQQTEDNALQMLIDYELPVSIDNVEAATLLMYDRGSLFKQIIGQKTTEQDDEATDNTEDEETSVSSSVLEGAESFIEAMTDKKAAKAAYEDIINEANKAVENLVYEKGNGYLDVRAAQSLFKGLSLASNLAKEENYEIPVNIDGEITSINLKIYHNAARLGKVAVTMETEKLGKVAAELTVNEKNISGMLVYENKQSKEEIQNIEKAIKNGLGRIASENGTEPKNIQINVVQTASINLDNFGSDREVSEDTISTKELYMTAKGVIKALSR